MVSGAWLRQMSDPWAEYRQRMSGNFAGQPTGATIPSAANADASARLQLCLTQVFQFRALRPLDLLV